MTAPARKRPFRKHSVSLALRLFFLAAVWSLIALAAAYMVLIAYYHTGVERAFEAVINLHLFNVVAAIQQDEVGQIYGNPQLGDPRFESFLSGWYWQAIRLGEKTVRAMGRTARGVKGPKLLKGDSLVSAEAVKDLTRADRMKILCARCRRKATLEK